MSSKIILSKNQNVSRQKDRGYYKKQTPQEIFPEALKMYKNYE